MERDDRTSDVAIAAVSRALDIPVPTIRSWERRYGVPAPPRTDGLHRRYSRTEIDQLRQLRDLITRGFPAREAARRVRAGGSTDGSREFIDGLIASALRLDTDGIRAALELAEERFGVEATLRDVALPSMREIGARWKAGVCSVEQEHLATHVVRTWCGRQVALMPPPTRPDPIVLSCGPKDQHTIGLEAFGVILGRRGWPCRVLGAITPTDALLGAVRDLDAAGAVVTAQRGVTRRAAIESIAAVDAVPGTRAFYAGDAFSAPSARRGVPGTYLGTDVVAAADVLESALDDPRSG
jgi:DNA-binding transcriptional MerR regulator